MPANPTHSQAPDALYVRYGDTLGIESWVGFHEQRHHSYIQAAYRLGQQLNSVILTGTVDEDWFGRHLLAHMALNSLFAAGGGVLIPSLEKGRWQGQDDFYDWHRRHALVHSRLDIAFGIH